MEALKEGGWEATESVGGTAWNLHSLRVEGNVKANMVHQVFEFAI